MKAAPKSKWIKFSIVTLLYILWLIWVGNYWLLLLIPFIFDVYITKYIPWGGWKNSKNKSVKKVMEWVDAIVFALVAVYFINIFFFQNYQIPTSSLEKTLLVGDFLFVGKYNYGARVPNTPLSFPLAQHTLPVLDIKSYIDWPQWPYKRLKGPGKVQRNDIVVFNFPTGDTVALKNQNTDYYTLCVSEAYLYYRNTTGQIPDLTYEEAFNLGRKIVHSNKNAYGDVVYRPVDRRENYVKRCVGLPGDTLEIKDNQLYINGVQQKNPKKMQLNYLVETDGTRISPDNFRKLHVSEEDQQMARSADMLLQKGFQADSVTGLFRPVYEIPLTQEALEMIKTFSFVKKVVVAPAYGFTYPLCYNPAWSMENYGPVWIPEKGSTLTLTKENYPIYERVIRNYENNTFEVKGGVFYINGERTDKYTFKMDYYWMMGDNRHKSADSRSWGFVPEDHIVGKPLLIWLSLDKDRGWFNGKIRWNRLFTTVKAE
ncbi:MAG: S26 family signal peptidase [Candidatus Azobacteroides sp.]|nr:S26 family signal peptidase [Candidatus Azobacteroides sp.]